MRRIFRRDVTANANGQPLISRSERLTDDGRGQTHVVRQRQAIRCSGCGRLVEELSELRGRCQHCGRYGTCSHCAAACQVCGRLLCGHCRRGFAGSGIRLTVCPTCQLRLWQRQRFEDRVRLSELAFRRQVAHENQWARLQALRLHTAKLGMQVSLTALRERHRYLMQLLRARYRAWRNLR